MKSLIWYHILYALVIASLWSTQVEGQTVQSMKVDSTNNKMIVTSKAGGSVNLPGEVRGVWTPVLGGSGGDPTSVVYASANEGIYRRQGSIVTVKFRLEFTTFTGGSGNVEVKGFPYSGASENLAVSGGDCESTLVDFEAGYTQFTVRDPGEDSTQTVFIQSGDNASGNSLDYGNSAVVSSGSTKAIRCTLTYFTDDPL